MPSRSPLSSGSLLRCLALGLVTLSCLVSLSANPPPPPEPTFRLLSLAGSSGGLHYEIKSTGKSGENLKRVVLDQKLSAYHRRPAGTTMEFFREFPVPPGSPPGTKPVRKVGLIASTPPENSRILIVTIPKSSRRTDLLASYTIPDDSPAHRAGTVLAVNYSSHPSVVALGNVQVPIAVGGSAIIPIPPDASEFILQVALQKGKRWTGVYKSEFSTNPTFRGYLIFADYVQDPDYQASAIPPPALVTAAFEVSPEAPHLTKTLVNK